MFAPEGYFGAKHSLAGVLPQRVELVSSGKMNEGFNSNGDPFAVDQHVADAAAVDLVGMCRAHARLRRTDADRQSLCRTSARTGGLHDVPQEEREKRSLTGRVRKGEKEKETVADERLPEGRCA